MDRGCERDHLCQAAALPLVVVHGAAGNVVAGALEGRVLHAGPRCVENIIVRGLRVATSGTFPWVSPGFARVRRERGERQDSAMPDLAEELQHLAELDHRL